ncbi:hypothetical protein LINPERPRIM_LOCUS1810 [Linum perenne]
MCLNCSPTYCTMAFLEPLSLHLFWGYMNLAIYWLPKTLGLSLGFHTLFQVGRRGLQYR